MRSKTIPIALAMSLGMAGCSTDLTVKAVGQDGPGVGQVFYLPVGELDSVTTWQLNDCKLVEEEKLDESGQKITEIVPTLDVTTTVAPTVDYVADYTQPYVIPYYSLNSPLKKTSFATTAYPAGTLKTINVSVKDQTGAVLANLGKSAVNVAKVAVRVLGAGKVGGPKLPEPCNDRTKVAIQRKDDLNGQLKKLRQQLLETPVNDRPKIEAEITGLEKKLAPYLAQLTYTKTFVETPELSAASHDWVSQTPPPDELLRKWLSEQALSPGQGWLNTITENMTVHTEIYAPAGKANGDALPSTTAGSSLPYRQPVATSLIACVKQIRTAADLAAKCADLSDEAIVARSSLLLPQAGIVGSLALHNGPFDANTLTAEFSPAGGLAAFGYTEESQLEAATAALANTTESAASVTEVIETGETLRLQQEVDRQKLENELLKLKQERDQLLSTTSTP